MVMINCMGDVRRLTVVKRGFGFDDFG